MFSMDQALLFSVTLFAPKALNLSSKEWSWVSSSASFGAIAAIPLHWLQSSWQQRQKTLSSYYWKESSSVWEWEQKQ
ncbi:hypothetical protein GAYE_SCF04G2527 [Galdieria yellowstonensis]|uniref:Uncharacterized protein n=1 Tax=Galdieria yellowstonensis TaxID=3028027 RepID=A0AAV9IBF3_9RHOD|nr:hypothetical protein GAYE_SCF04G2527 [Galdieria yellowstonensis]